MPGEGEAFASGGGAPPPLTEEEIEQAKAPAAPPPAPVRKTSTPAVFRRALAGVLAIGFGLLFFYLALELIQTTNLLLSWPPWAGWPVLALLLSLVGYAVYRLGRILVSFRRLPIVERLEPGELERCPARRKDYVRDQLAAQLRYLREQRAGRDDDPLAEALGRLEAQVPSHPAGAWIRDYDREILAPLGREARDRVRKIALTAGTSAALSPWRILDAVIAFNAATQSAYEVLRIHGIRPDQTVALAFAFDTFLNTFLATVVEDVSSDLADSLTAQISAETGASAAKALAPKVAEALATAVFVRRLGNRMIRRLHPFPA